MTKCVSSDAFCIEKLHLWILPNNGEVGKYILIQTLDQKKENNKKAASVLITLMTRGGRADSTVMGTSAFTMEDKNLKKLGRRVVQDLQVLKASFFKLNSS